MLPTNTTMSRTEFCDRAQAFLDEIEARDLSPEAELEQCDAVLRELATALVSVPTGGVETR